MFFSLNQKDFGHNYKELDKAFKFLKGAANSMAYFSTKDGGGRFTNLVSQYAIEFIKECIDDPNKMNPAPNWPALNPEWADKSSAYGYGQHWKFKGEIQKNIDIIYRGRHTQTIGIRRDIKVPRIGWSGKPRGLISVAAYAAMREWGGNNVPAAPLFRPAIRTFVKNNWPDMVKAVDKAMESSIKDYGDGSISSNKSIDQIFSTGGKLSNSGKNILKKEINKNLKSNGSNKAKKEI